jgi:hypothetical protein
MSMNVYIEDADERTAPPTQQVLEVGVVGDSVFLALGLWTEDTNERRFVTSAGQQISVPLQDLSDAIVAASNASA